MGPVMAMVTAAGTISADMEAATMAAIIMVATGAKGCTMS